MQKIWDEIAKEYSKRKFFGFDLFKEEKEKLPIFLENCKTILDAGCGTGRHLNFFEKLDKKVVGIDISKKMIKEARKKFRGYLAIGNILSLPFKDKAFDCAICLGNSLGSLLENWKDGLKELIRISKKKVIVEVRVSKESKIEKRFWNKKKFYLVKVWSLEEIEKELKKMKLRFKIEIGHKFKNYFFVYWIIDLKN
ncbi:MAG: hypothetical protein B6U78_01455 [Candidatus Aenigmarchaeota archaeon ex4484_224]|nr:MAG: hypothetical protein B6U78_01455 [Candidatus Aenigmarchaeota archaeon ex4484_224]